MWRDSKADIEISNTTRNKTVTRRSAFEFYGLPYSIARCLMTPNRRNNPPLPGACSDKHHHTLNPSGIALPWMACPNAASPECSIQHIQAEILKANLSQKKKEKEDIKDIPQESLKAGLNSISQVPASSDYRPIFQPFATTNAQILDDHTSLQLPAAAYSATFLPSLSVGRVLVVLSSTKVAISPFSSLPLQVLTLTTSLLSSLPLAVISSQSFSMFGSDSRSGSAGRGIVR